MSVNVKDNLNEDSFLSIFKKVFSGITVNSVEKNSYRLPPERELASELNNNFSRAEINYQMRRLRDSGIIDSRRGDGNYLVSNIPQAVATSLAVSLEQLWHLKYFDSKDINETREFFELSIYEFWVFLHPDDQDVILSQLKLVLHKMCGSYNKYQSELDDNKRKNFTNKIISNDIEFHKIIGGIAGTTLLSTFINAISALQQNEIHKFWFNATDKAKSILIEDHYNIIRALEKCKSLKICDIENKRLEELELFEKTKNEYQLAITSHYVDILICE